MSCWETVQDYAFRSIGFGERLLPRSDFTLCDQITLIGSGLIWNVYFGAFAMALGFLLAVAVALGKSARNPLVRKPAEWFIFVFRGSPLFIQFFLAYEAFVLLPRNGIELNLIFVEITAETRWLTRAWAGALIVLFLNTAAYSGEIFFGALKSIPQSADSRASLITLAACSRALEGMQPRYKHTPPGYVSGSIKDTFIPRSAARNAAAYPPGPAPITTS